MSLGSETLGLAYEVSRICASEGHPLLLIGAMAMAAHGYARWTLRFFASGRRITG